MKIFIMRPKGISFKRNKYIKGQKVGNCIFLAEIEYEQKPYEKRKAYFECKCGAIFVYDIHLVLYGNKKYCKRCGEKARRTTHGMGNRSVPEYDIWNKIKGRCNNPLNEDYHRYGGRGIIVSEEWVGKDGFKKFYDHIGPRPSKDHSIDRWPNKNGNYEPGNVRWATRKEQSNNRRDNILITHNGETKTLSEWCDILKLEYQLIQQRISKYKWTFEKAISAPKMQFPNIQRRKQSS